MTLIRPSIVQSIARSLSAGTVIVAALSPVTAAAQAPPAGGAVIAIVDVDVIAMRSSAIQRRHTVLVRGDTIVAVGPVHQIQVPENARRIPGSGRFLIPGLADFHVHVAERSDLQHYLAAGVTTIAHMGGNSAALLAWRDSVRAGSIVGPEIYVGYFMNGPLGLGGVQTIGTADEARNGVADAARRNFDFVKVYNSLTEEQYTAILEESKARGLAVMGHGVRSVGLERGFALGQVAVVHAEEYMYADLRRRRDSALLPWIVDFTRRPDATLIPNLSAFAAITRQWGRPAVIDSFLAQPEARQLTPFWRTRWKSADYVTRRGTLDALPFLMDVTRAMQRGGVRLLLGTDSPSIPGVFAGASIHDELRLLVAAGLTPYDALVAGTRAAGEFAVRHMHARPVGVIAPGYRADLVLLAGNPLEDVGHARAPIGVMTRGRWLER
jgi:hypothetical protein